MATERIIEGHNVDKASRLVSALNIALSQEGKAEPPKGQFGFKAIIETEKTRLTNDVLDFEYDIPFDDDIVPNESEIVMLTVADVKVLSECEAAHTLMMD